MQLLSWSRQKCSECLASALAVPFSSPFRVGMICLEYCRHECRLLRGDVWSSLTMYFQRYKLFSRKLPILLSTIEVLIYELFMFFSPKYKSSFWFLLRQIRVSSYLSMNVLKNIEPVVLHQHWTKQNFLLTQIVS